MTKVSDNLQDLSSVITFESLTTQNLSNTEILELAKQIKETEKVEKERIETERREKVISLIDTCYSLGAEKSDSINNELLKISKDSDFCEYFISVEKNSKGETFQNYCYYNGSTVTRIKQDGTISVKSLPKKVFISRGCNMANFYTSVGYTSGTDTAMELFETAKGIFEQNEYKKASNEIDTNKGAILKNKITNTVLIRKNKDLKKAKK